MTEAEVKRARYQSDQEFRARVLQTNRASKRRNGRTGPRVRPPISAGELRTDCRVRKAELQRRWRAMNSDHVRHLREAWVADRAAIVNPRATNGRTPWSDAEIRILLDPTLSATEAALMLGRTVDSVYNKRWKLRRAAA